MTPSTTIGKRKEQGEENDVKVGDRVKVRFDNDVWYAGSITSAERGKVAEVVRVGIRYDDDDEEEASWPDKDIVLIDDEVLEERKTEKKKKKKRRNEEIEVEVGRMYRCGEGDCQYVSKKASNVSHHHQAKAEGVTPDIYFEIPAVEAGHLKQEKFTCVGDIKTISRCKTYYGYRPLADEGKTVPIHLTKAAKPIERREAETFTSYAKNLKLVDHIWGGIPEDSNVCGNFTRRLSALGGIQPLVSGGLGEVNMKRFVYAAHKMYISGNAKSFESARALKRAHYAKAIGMVIVKSKALHKIKALNLCANTKLGAVENYNAAKSSFVWDFTYQQSQDYFEFAGAFGGFPFNDERTLSTTIKFDVAVSI